MVDCQTALISNYDHYYYYYYYYIQTYTIMSTPVEASPEGMA